MSEFKVWPARKVVDSSFIWRRLDGSYSCLSGASVVDGLIYYCQQKGIATDVFGRGISKDIEEYFRKRKIETNNNVVEDKCRQFNDKFVGTMFIESRNKKKEIKHMLRVSDVVSKDSTYERKYESLRSMNLLCTCDGALYQIYLIAPDDVRIESKDDRRNYDIPSPQIVMPLDTHSVTGMNWLVEERKAEDFGIFGLREHTIEIAKHTVGSALDGHMPEYKLSSFLRDKTDLFNPLKDRLKASLI